MDSAANFKNYLNLGNLNPNEISENFYEQMTKKIEEGFMNDEFFKKLLIIAKNNTDVEFAEDIDIEEIKKLTGNKNEKSENRKDLKRHAFIKKILDFSYKCYVHGVTIGMRFALEIYEKNKEDNNC